MVGHIEGNAFGIAAEVQGLHLSVGFVSPKIVRVQLSAVPPNNDRLSLMRVPFDGQPGSIQVEDNEADCVLRSSELQVTLDKTSGAIRYADASGQVLLTETRGLEPVVLERKVPLKDSYKVLKTVDGTRRLPTRFSPESVATHQAQLHLDWADGEALYGLGAHEEAHMNLRGTAQRLYQHNLKLVMPVLCSSKGYGLLFDAYCNMDFKDGSAGGRLQFDAVEALDYYFMLGPDMHGVVKGYRQLTGKAVMLPKSAFGYVQSKEHYHTQDELLDAAAEFRMRKIPLDMIVQDWRYWPEDAWSGFVWDESRYPDPARMCDTLHAQHIKLMVSIWPNIGGGPRNQAMLEQGLSMVGGDMIDAYRKDGRDFYWECVQEALFSKGVDAFWTDSTEPVIADWEDKERTPDFNERNIEALCQVLGHEEMNAYGMQHARGIYENQRETSVEKRVLTLTRSSYAGMQRYGAVSWSGDISAKWSTLAQQIPAGLNFAASGHPYWTLDVGGFFVGSRPENPVWFWNGDFENGVGDLGYRELYTRWFQYGTFLPMFRSHGTDTPREPWQFGEPGTPFYDTILRFIDLRYQLMPYIYSLAGAVVVDDASIMVPLAFDFAEDPQVLDIKDQFMFGPALMVCPVVEPMYYGPGSAVLDGVEKSREVYLPAGTDWYDFWTNERFAGGQTLTVDAPLETIPLFVRAGSIIPLGPKVQYSDEKGDAEWTMLVYPGADASFRVYEDSGDGYGYENGEFSSWTINWKDKTSTFGIDARKGSYPGMLPSRPLKVVMMGREQIGDTNDVAGN